MIFNSSEIKAIEQKEFKLRKNSFSLMQSAGENVQIIYQAMFQKIKSF